MTASTETKPTTTQSSSRRALLAGAIGGLGAWAAGAIGRAGPVRAADGDPILIGSENTGATTTQISATNVDVFKAEVTSAGLSPTAFSGYAAIRGVSPSGTGVFGNSDSYIGVVGLCPSGAGVEGSSTSGTGVVGGSLSYIGVVGYSGASDQPAVVARSNGDSTGVLGYSNPGGGAEMPAAKPKTGVYGYAVQDSGSKGVWGYSDAGRGVQGDSADGIGVYASSPNGYAIRSDGRVKLTKVTGVATIPAGTTGVTVSPQVSVTNGTLVMLSPRTNIGSRGLWYVPHPAQGNFRIRLSSSRSSATKIAWLLLG